MPETKLSKTLSSPRQKRNSLNEQTFKWKWNRPRDYIYTVEENRKKTR